MSLVSEVVLRVRIVFAHSTDNQAAISNDVNPLRFQVYTQLYNDGFSLPPQIFYEISKEQLDAALGHRARHLERVTEQAANELAARAQRPRMHDNSRSPRSIPSDRDSITPDPQRRVPENYDDLLRLGKGKGRGDGSTKMDVDAETVARPRDLTSGGADDEGSDREEEVAAPIDDDNMGIYPPQNEEPRSLSPNDQDVDPEPTPQLADESGDVIMKGNVPTVDV